MQLRPYHNAAVVGAIWRILRMVCFLAIKRTNNTIRLAGDSLEGEEAIMESFARRPWCKSLYI